MGLNSPKLNSGGSPSASSASTIPREKHPMAGIARKPSPSLRPVIFGIFLLAVSPILIFPPGTDVSPYAAYYGALTPITYGGVTVQVWSILALLTVCGFGLLRVGFRSGSPGVAWTIAAAASAIVGGALTTSDFALLAEGIGKLLLPLLIFSFATAIKRSGDHRKFATLALLINIFTLGQAFVCKFATGRFAANTYYIELPEEYFGYFYHPFAFVGVVSACTIVVVNEFVQGRRRPAMALLLVLNFAFIYQTQVRTYILAVAVALLVAFIGTTFGRRSPLATIVVAFLLSLLALLLGRNLVAGSRVTSDASSGRLDRWTADIESVWGNAPIHQLILGGGPSSIFELNQQLFGVYINSLNAAIDIFVDYGLLGLLTALTAWALLIRDQYRSTQNPLMLSAAVLLLISATVTSPLEFPVVGVVLVVAMLALDSIGKRPVSDGQRLRRRSLFGIADPELQQISRQKDPS